MKLSNPTLGTAPLALVFALSAFTLPACDSSGDGDSSTSEGTSDTETDDDDDSGTTDNPTTTTDPSTTTDDSDPSSGDPTEEGSSSSGEVVIPDGFGCDAPPACDRGELVGSIVVDETTTDVSDLAGYTSITGWVEISGSGLECLNFLSCLETVGHDVTIFGNDALMDTTGLDTLTTLGTATADLPLAGPGVECPCRDGTFVFSENNGIVDLNGVNGLQQTQISLNIAENASMTTISGFGSLVGTQRDFSIRFNPVLTDVDAGGLKDMLFIGGECSVTNNPSLCISDIQDMCGDLKQGPFGGNTANNDMSC